MNCSYRRHSYSVGFRKELTQYKLRMLEAKGMIVPRENNVHRICLHGG